MSKDTVSLLAHQIELEKLYSKNQLIPRISAEFTNSTEFDFKKYMESKNIDYDFGISLLVQMALHKRCNLPTLVGLLRHHASNGQAVVNEILKCAEADLVHWDPDLAIFVVAITISQDVQDDLDRFQFPLPMVIEPKILRNNKQSGYILNQRSVILKNNHHDDDVCLDHLNRMNKVKFTINNKTATMVKNQWRNLDKVKEGETREDFMRRKRAFEKYDRTAHEVIGLLTKEGNEFYLTHSYCKRGRTYCRGYHVNYQGTAWNKAVIEFAEQEVTPI